MWLGTRVNIWKTLTYLNRLKWLFCSRLQAGLPMTSACFEEQREYFLQALIQIEKIMFYFDFNRVSRKGFIARTSFFTAYLSLTCSLRANVSLQALAVSASKMWFHSLVVQVVYFACITHCSVALVAFSC